MWPNLRAWVRQRRVQRKLGRFLRLATAQGWLSMRLPHPHPLCHGRVVVLAPHVDDEAIGCGGTLRLHRQAGDAVQLIYVLADRQSQALREAEGTQAGKLLGASTTHLRCPRTLDVIVAALAEIFRHTSAPAVTYVPWMLDNHEDHLLIAQALGQLLAMGIDCGQVWCYEVWTPLIPNRIVDITGVLPQKRQLLEQYASQRAQKDIVQMGLGLSHYRGGLLAAKDAVAAEVFLALAPAAYQQALRQLRGP